jgi:ABC-type transport system substrate-binding protein/class 3 adenylate cyclase/tRNA A-37 threonylcarbamoyl transferase component Bud32/streptogramin lyase
VTELGHGVALAGYRIEALIGRGSTGSVYSAEDVALKRRVALKVLLPELARDERFRERFLRESRLAAALEHPHIVPIHAVGESDGVLFLAMRYVGGRDLAALLDRVGRLEPERALRICAHVAAALDAAHAHDLVHRDVKPGNVLLAREDDEDFAYLCDFGLAKHGASVTSLTGARDIVGTVGYLSPEQIDGLPVDGRTDVYALGCLLFECLVGEPPFVRENELATILAHRSEPPPLVSDRRPELPEALDAVLARALAKDREARYATCGELVRDGRRALAGGAVEAPPPATHAGPAVHTFVFADIRGYTAYMREHGDEVGAQLAQRFASIVEALAPAHGGTPPRLRGDEALVMFDSARAALRYAVELQRRVADEQLPRGVGIGLDAGEAVVGGDDLHGGGLNRAARLCARARAGQILATDGVTHLAGRFEGVRYGLRQLERLKGFEQPVGVIEVHPGDWSPRHERRRRLARALRGRGVGLAAAAAALAAVAAVLVVLLGGGGTEEGTRFEADSIAVLNARTGAPVGTIAPGLKICVFATAGNDLWACDADQSILLRVDTRARRVVDQVPLPVYHGSFTIGFGSIWVGDVGSPTVRKVSPRFRTSSPPIRLPGVPSQSPTGQPQNVGSMVTTRTAVWAAYGFPKRIARIDPDSAKVTFSAPLRQDCPCDVLLAAGDGKLWAVGGDGAHIYRLDPDTGKTIATGRLHHGSVTGVAVAGGYLWVAMREDGGVWKIDDSGSSIDKVATGRGPESVAAADGAVWVANADDATVTRIDPGSNATRRFRVGHRPLAVAAVGGQVFVGLGQSAAEAAAGLSGPKAVRALSPDFALAADPANVNGPGDLMLGRAGGAGLMAAVTDARGATTIEPELARAAPFVSRDGRTYTFELRPGLRFSSGEPVTAEAVRYSIERAVSPKLLNHYCRDAVLGDVAGEDAYQAGKADRISGIAVRGERVTITLAAPSPTLPARLTNPCLSVVPPGTPNIPVGLHRPIPSAGPYYIDSFVRGRQLVLRRNPHYAGPRPQALDALIAGGGIAPAEGGARVERGSADYAADPGSPPTPAFAEGGRYERSFGSAGGRLRYVRPPSVVSGFILFNTRRGIFRSPELRRAANLAIDRAALVRSGGGEARSLLIPPGVPGYRDAQAYPLHPDLERARALARGRGGSAVLALPAERQEFKPVARQLRDDLARIGVDVRLRPLADPAAAAADPSQSIDAVLDGWAPDYPDPFGVVNLILQPGVRLPFFPDFFGERRWVRRLERAAAAPLERRDAVYAKLDADLARGPAPFAVLGSPPGVGQLLSARLGCERFAYGLIDFASLCVDGE